MKLKKKDQLETLLLLAKNNLPIEKIKRGEWSNLRRCKRIAEFIAEYLEAIVEGAELLKDGEFSNINSIKNIVDQYGIEVKK